MRLHSAALALLLAGSVQSFTQPTFQSRIVAPTTRGSSVSVTASAAIESALDDVDYESVNKLTFRELQRECKVRGLAAVGSTAVLRQRLLENEGVYNGATDKAETETEEPSTPTGISFTDSSDPDYEFNTLLSQINEKSSIGHWKAAARKLKQITRRFPTRPIPAETYLSVLSTCADDRLHGARAATPARKIMEEMADRDHSIPENVGNKCILNCLGIESGGKHDGCGGIDVALAMMTALERSGATVALETYGAVATALAKDGSIDEAIALVRLMVVDRGYTPNLSTLADVAMLAAKAGKSEDVLQVLTLAKAAGYVLDGIASASAGRDVLAAGVIAAEKMDNLALGLRLLTAAGKAEGCAPDQGDVLVANSGVAAQRACTLIHKRAITKAGADGNWKLAVKLLEIMSKRGLVPSTYVWRTVVTSCAKNEKSRKATAILLDWVKLAKEDKADKPPLSIFNTVLNACEICGEEELTLTVMQSMKQIHDTDGNLITFNIALKRLAKLGQKRACEGIIVAMIDSGVAPSVVSYTTAIGACARQEGKDGALAYEWLQRMKLMGVKPNFHTYNTALAACLDGGLENTIRGSRIATEMLDAINKELVVGLKGNAELKSAMPDTYTKTLARALMKQLRENWRNNEINMVVAKATLRVPLLKLVDFDKSAAAEQARKQIEEAKKNGASDVEEAEETPELVKDEEEIEYAAVNKLHKEGRRNVEV